MANMNMDDPDVKRAIADGDIALWNYIVNQHSDNITWKDVKCDMIKGNESDVGNIDFELQA